MEASQDLPKMTYEELLDYTGDNEATSNKTYLAIKGVVFDVSAAEFYKPGGPYHAFAGHDASVALAKMSKDTETLDPKKFKWQTSLNDQEKEMLENWFKRLSDKYQKVAQIHEA